MAAANLWLRLTRREFRGYAHPRAALVTAAESHGLRLVHERRAARVADGRACPRMILFCLLTAP